MLTRGTCINAEPTVHVTPREQLNRPVTYAYDELKDIIGERPYAYGARYPIYDQYIGMKKGLADPELAPQLQQIGDSLSGVNYPTILNVAGSAYAEAALVSSGPVAEKLQQLELAEKAWMNALILHDKLHDTALDTLAHDVDAPYRYALSLATCPLLKAVAIGNVTKTIRTETYKNVLSIVGRVSDRINELHVNDGSLEERISLSGLMHEGCIMLAGLQDDDDTRITIPSNVRSGDGNHDPSETFDVGVLLLNGDQIRSCVPIEAKTNPTVNDYERYGALIVSRDDLVPKTSGKSEHFLVRAFSAVYHECATPAQVSFVEQATNRLHNKIDKYIISDMSREPMRFGGDGHMHVRCRGVLGSIAAFNALGQ